MTAALFASLEQLRAAAKKEEKKAIKTALVAGTEQTLSNLFRDFQYLWDQEMRTPKGDLLNSW